MTERSAWAVKVYGPPAPKGSLKCVGGKGRHQLIENSTRTKPWRALVEKAGRALQIPEPLTGPVGATMTFTLELPKSIKPETRLWPLKKSAGLGGDVDKLARTVLDGLQDAGVLVDDSQVCELTAVKAYPHTDVADVLDRPGAVIRIYLL